MLIVVLASMSVSAIGGFGGFGGFTSDALQEYLDDPEALVDHVCEEAWPIGNWGLEMVAGFIETPIEGTTPHVFCGDEELGPILYQPIGDSEIFISNTFECDTDLIVKLMIDDYELPPNEVINCANGFTLYKYDTTQVPVFGVIGGALAGLGSLAVYAKKRRK